MRFLSRLMSEFLPAESKPESKPERSLPERVRCECGHKADQNGLFLVYSRKPPHTPIAVSCRCRPQSWAYVARYDEHLKKRYTLKPLDMDPGYPESVQDELLIPDQSLKPLIAAMESATQASSKAFIDEMMEFFGRKALEAVYQKRAQILSSLARRFA